MTIEFFYDIASSYSYLAATQVDGVGERVGREVVWRPFLLGAVFKATGNQSPAMIAAKGSWMGTDLAQWAEHYEVPFTFNPNFPPNSLRVQRVLASVAANEGQDALRELSMAVYRAHWGDASYDATTEDGFRQALAGTSFDPAELWARAGDPAVKELLKESTNEAIERGAFGAPTFFVGDDMYWGNDRLSLLEAIYARDV